MPREDPLSSSINASLDTAAATLMRAAKVVRDSAIGIPDEAAMYVRQAAGRLEMMAIGEGWTEPPVETHSPQDSLRGSSMSRDWILFLTRDGDLFAAYYLDFLGEWEYQVVRLGW